MTVALRRAIVRGEAATLATVAAYLPANYRACSAYDARGNQAILITGYDSAGWTLDDYVIPRLASGLIFASEV